MNDSKSTAAPRLRAFALQLSTCIALFGVGTIGLAADAGPSHFPSDPADTPAYTLPELLVGSDGRKVTTAQEWQTRRRPEILELFRHHVYGRVPATAYEQSFKVVNEDRNAMGGAATLRQVEITITAAGKSLVIALSLFVPNGARKPSPTFLLICNRPPGENIDPTRLKKSEFWPAEEAIARGYAMAAFFNGDVDPDDKTDIGHKDGIHALLDRGGRAPDAWGTLAAWAWGASRCMDYLQTDPAVARDQVAVIGHSRGGKTALWAGAQDERFAMVCANDSGCGGAALTRRRAPKKETVAMINRDFPHWFNANFKAYNDRHEAMPVDQHMLLALIAPRAACVASASLDVWADPRGEFLGLANARPAYQLFGHEGLGANAEMPAIGGAIHGDRAHYHLREGRHNLTLADWTSYMDFADRLFGQHTAAVPRGKNN